MFVSSISAAGNWTALPGARMKVPEVELEDWKVARLGYGQSKLVSERLLAEACRQSDGSIDTAICRVGQVAGPILHGCGRDGLDETSTWQRGMWPQQEWVPSLIASSKALGKLPTILGPLNDVDWIPVDIVASIMVELLTAARRSDPKPKAQFFHVVNPAVKTWTELVPTILKRLGPVQSVSLEDWVDELQRSMDEETIDITSNPAARLLPFFENLQDRAVRFPKAKAALLDTKRTVKCSHTLSSLSKVDAE